MEVGWNVTVHRVTQLTTWNIWHHVSSGEDRTSLAWANWVKAEIFMVSTHTLIHTHARTHTQSHICTLGQTSELGAASLLLGCRAELGQQSFLVVCVCVFVWCDLLSGDKVTATGYTDISILSLLANVWLPTRAPNTTEPEVIYTSVPARAHLLRE